MSNMTTLVVLQCILVGAVIGMCNAVQVEEEEAGPIGNITVVVIAEEGFEAEFDYDRIGSSLTRGIEYTKERFAQAGYNVTIVKKVMQMDWNECLAYHEIMVILADLYYTNGKKFDAVFGPGKSLFYLSLSLIVFSSE